MFTLSETKKGRGIPKGKYNIIKLALEKDDPEDSGTYTDITETSRSQKIPKHAVVKGVLKTNRKLIRDFHK